MAGIGYIRGIGQKSSDVLKVSSDKVLFHQDVLANNVSGIANLSETGFTLAMWVNVGYITQGDNSQGLRINANTRDACQIGFNLQHVTNCVTLLIANSSDSWINNVSTSFYNYSNGEKFHLCITAAAGDNVEIYVNGVYVGTAGISIVSSTRNTLVKYINYESDRVTYSDFILTKGRIWNGDFTPPCKIEVA